ncbi:hypothetical protein [Streptomyces sp. enrichment culture]|uniref:hypothetical protein n=1 Tax=Streptomyces sp. enrichment culture TaxID=1795815 RepID=UPI003F5541A4
MAIVALVVSLASALGAIGSWIVAQRAFRFSENARQETEKLNKRDLFLALHEKLCTPDQLWGRRVIREKINNLADAKQLRESGHADGQAAAGAVAMLDMLSLYVEKGFIERDLVLEEWGHVLADLDDNAAIFVKDRTMNNRRPWVHFQDFSADAVKWSRAHPR